MGAFSKIQAYRFASLLSKPFQEWDAFKLKLIDEKGNIIKKPKSSEEKKSMDSFENLVRKIKKLLIRYIPDTRLFQFMIGTYLLKTEDKDNYTSEEKNCIEELNKELNDKDKKILYGIILQLNKMNYRR